MSKMDTSIDLQACRQLFKETLPTIQEIASFKVAISLWYNFMFDENFDSDEDELGDSLNEKYRKEVEKLLQNFTSPHLIQDVIKESLIKVENEIDSWICYNKYETLPRDKIIIFRDHLKCLVWQSDGKIDYRQTARKMLSFNDLSKVEKFGIMCTYCLEDEIKNSTLDAELESFFDDVDFESSPLTFYWICYKKNELDKVPLQPNAGSLEGFMITQNEVDNWFAIEYFWNRLSEQDQITKATLLLTKWFFVKFQKQLLSRLNDCQLLQVFSNIPVEILVNFWTRLAEPETAFTIWTMIKNSMSGIQFSTLVEKILEERIYSEEYVKLIVRLWHSADDRHKRHLLDQREDLIIKNYFRSTFCTLPNCLKFLHAMLSYSSPSYRERLIREHGDGLIVNDHFSEVDKIINLCFPNEEEVVKYKKQIMKSAIIRNHCNKLFCEGDFDYLNKFIEFYILDKPAMKNYKKLILESNDIESVFIFSPTRWTALEKLINDVYPDAIFARSVKERLILASGMKCFYDWTNIDLLHQLIKVATQFLNDEDMVKLKESLLDRFRRMIMGGSYWKSFDEKYWHDFAYWCLGSEEKIKEFKSTLPIDKIFNEIMEIMTLRYIYENEFIVEMLSVMDNFLKWYLVEPHKVKEYKLCRIFAFNDLEIIEATIATREEENTRTLLFWFLENDEEQICKFKSQFSNEKVSKMI